MEGLIYAMVSNDKSTSPLGEVSLANGNFQLLALKILSKCKNDTNISKSFSYENTYMFHYHNKSEVTVLCMCDASFPNQKAFGFLFCLWNKVNQTYGEDIKKAIAFSIKKPFIEEIRKMMNEFNTEDENKLQVVNKNVDELKNIVVQSLEKVMERGEKIDLLVENAEKLRGNAKIFLKGANKVKRHFCIEHLKVVLLVVLIVLAIGGVVTITACGGFDFERCK